MEDYLDVDAKVVLREDSESRPILVEAQNTEPSTNIVSSPNIDKVAGEDEAIDTVSNYSLNKDIDAPNDEPMDTSLEETLDRNEKSSQDKEMNFHESYEKVNIEPPNVNNDDNKEEADILDEGELQYDNKNSNIDQTDNTSVNRPTQLKSIEETVFENYRPTDIDSKPAEDTNMDMNSTENIEISKSCIVGSDEDSKSTGSGKEKSKTTESAFQRLASFGLIATEEPVEESKESLLKKLASRGSISITPSGSSITPSQSSSVSIAPALLKHKPEPKSAVIKQKSKKIKIDPGKSMDIDKDFDSLINFLSAGNNSELGLEQNKPPSPIESTENAISNENTLTDLSEPKNDADSCIEKTSDEVNGVGLVEDTVCNETPHEIDTESHDELKLGQSSDYPEDNDERLSVTSQPRNVIEEGSAEILLSAKNVFYNKVQEFNRDMSIAALTVFSEMHQQDPRTRNRGKKRKATDNNESDSSNTSIDDVFEPGKKSENGITILEALSATGLRSVRYAREIPGVKEIIANDLSEDAVESIKKNIEHNGVEDLVTTTRSDASFLMYKRQTEQEWYDAIDLDPYGCPSRFLDSAVQVVRDGGLLLVTCTDMAILAGNSPESCHAKYGAISLRSPACHEMAIRIALQCIESHANRYGRYIVPLFSFSADFYIRVIVQVYTSPVTCKRTTSKLSMVYQCTGCQTFSFHPLGAVSQESANTQAKFSLPHAPPVNINCFHCQHKHHMGGPIWTAPIYNSKFVESMLTVVEMGRFGTSKRMQGMLEVIREELPDAPLYYTISGLCSRLHCQAIPLIDIRSAILNAGYRVSSSHAAPTAIKTNAPSKVIWDIMRCWVHMNPISQKRLVAGSVPANIVFEPPSLIANFDIHPKARPSSSMRKLLRYQPNPEKNWGPGMKARINNSEEDKNEKRRLNQNKNKTKSSTKKTVEIIEVVTIDDEDEVTDETSNPPTEAVSVTSTT